MTEYNELAVPASLEYEIAKIALEVLKDHLITDVDPEDPSRADHVIFGPPTSERSEEIVVSLHTVHPLGPQKDQDELWMGQPVAADERPRYFPAEIGGYTTKKHIGTVQVLIRKRLTALEALRIVGIVIQRIEKAINKDRRLRTVRDEEGNLMSMMETFRGYGYAGGGGSQSNNIRWVDWRCAIHTITCRDD